MRKVLELKVVKVGKDETFSAWNDNQSYLLLGNCAKNQLATQDDDYKVHCLTSNDSERTVNGPIGSESSRNLPVNVPLHT